MPELPEIETIRRIIGPLIIGRRIRLVDVTQPKAVATPCTESFISMLTENRFIGLERRGKFLISELEDGCRLVMHMRMTGCLLVAHPDVPPEPHTHITISMDDGMELRFSDSRRFGRFWLYGPGEDIGACGISRLGPEPFSMSFNADYLKSRIGRSGRTIKECIMDQSVVAGIGNIYSDEILFDVGIDPSRPAYSLTRDEFEILTRDIPEKLEYFTEMNAVTPDEYLETKGRDYRNTPYLRVYGHAGEPCPICRTALVKRTIGGRGSVYCPKCQSRHRADT